MRKIPAFLALLVMICCHGALVAQEQPLNLWTDTIPGAIASSVYHEDTLMIGAGLARILRVTTPTIQEFAAPKEKATGTAVIICPGGGYGRLALQPEGIDIARWLNDAGITGIVLKYRLPNDTIMVKKRIGPLQDVQEAVRMVRRHAAEWGIDRQKIGVMGFSAGGHLASTAATQYNEHVYDADTTSARPDFSLLIYPVISMDEKLTHKGSRQNLLGSAPDQSVVDQFSNDLRVDKNTPPAFLVHSADDKTVPVQNSINYFLALKANNVPAELHVYETGGHGYGLALHRGTESNWPAACLQWLRVHRLL
jgi:acetyl esterase/lipase